MLAIPRLMTGAPAGTWKPSNYLDCYSFENVFWCFIESWCRNWCHQLDLSSEIRVSQNTLNGLLISTTCQNWTSFRASRLSAGFRAGLLAGWLAGLLSGWQDVQLADYLASRISTHGYPRWRGMDFLASIKCSLALFGLRREQGLLFGLRREFPASIFGFPDLFS